MKRKIQISDLRIGDIIIVREKGTQKHFMGWVIRISEGYCEIQPRRREKFIPHEPNTLKEVFKEGFRELKYAFWHLPGQVTVFENEYIIIELFRTKSTRRKKSKKK